MSLSLEALRAVNRHGIAAHGEQYTGFARLGSGNNKPTEMTIEQAAIALVPEGWNPEMLIRDKDLAKMAAERARNASHPDRGWIEGTLPRSGAGAARAVRASPAGDMTRSPSPEVAAWRAAVLPHVQRLDAKLRLMARLMHEAGRVNEARELWEEWRTVKRLVTRIATRGRL